MQLLYMIVKTSDEWEAIKSRKKPQNKQIQKSWKQPKWAQESINPHHLQAEKHQVEDYCIAQTAIILFHLIGDNIDPSLGCVMHIWTVFSIIQCHCYTSNYFNESSLIHFNYIIIWLFDIVFYVTVRLTLTVVSEEFCCSAYRLL